MRSNKGQLVSQYLEKIHWSALEKYLKKYIKGRNGVYALYRKTQLYYVGLASDLRNRLKIHLRDRHAQKWDTFSVYLTINNYHLPELETLILKIASPKGNKQSGNFINAQNLKSELKKTFEEEKYKESIKIGLNKKDKAASCKTTAQIRSKAILAPYIKKRFEIRLKYKGKTYKAMVRKDGTILYAGKVHNSPSMAARAIKERASNGWTSWKYERAPGDWLMLDYLRKK